MGFLKRTGLVVTIAIVAVLVKTLYDTNELKSFEEKPLECSHFAGLRGRPVFCLMSSN